MHYHGSDRFQYGKTIVDDRVFICPSCPFTGGEDAMVDHALLRGHIAHPQVMDRRMGEDRRRREALVMSK